MMTAAAADAAATEYDIARRGLNSDSANIARISAVTSGFDRAGNSESSSPNNSGTQMMITIYCSNGDEDLKFAIFVKLLGCTTTSEASRWQRIRTFNPKNGSSFSNHSSKELDVTVLATLKRWAQALASTDKGRCQGESATHRFSWALAMETLVGFSGYKGENVTKQLEGGDPLAQLWPQV
jgi:hypothetical protein